MDINFKYDKVFVNCTGLNSRETKTITGEIQLPKPKELDSAPISKIQLSKYSSSSYCYVRVNSVIFKNSNGEVISTVAINDNETSGMYTYIDIDVPSGANSIETTATFRSTYNYSLGNPGYICLFKATLDSNIAQYYNQNPGQIIAGGSTSEYPSVCNFELNMASNSASDDDLVYQCIYAPAGYIIPEGEHTYTIRTQSSYSQNFNVYLKQYDKNNNLLTEDKIVSGSTSLKTISYTVLPNVYKLVVEGKARTTGIYSMKWYLDFTSLKFARECNGWFKHRYMAEDSLGTARLTIEANGISDYNYHVFKDCDRVFYPQSKDDFSTNKNEYQNIYLEPTSKVTANENVTDLWVFKRQFPYNMTMKAETKRNVLNKNVACVINKNDIISYKGAVIENGLLINAKESIKVTEDTCDDTVANPFKINPAPSNGGGGRYSFSNSGTSTRKWTFICNFKTEPVIETNWQFGNKDGSISIDVENAGSYSVSGGSPEIYPYSKNIPLNKDVVFSISVWGGRYSYHSTSGFLDYIKITERIPQPTEATIITKPVDLSYEKDCILVSPIATLQDGVIREDYYSIDGSTWTKFSKDTASNELIGVDKIQYKSELSNTTNGFSFPLPMVINKKPAKIEPTPIDLTIDTLRYASNNVAIECDTNRFYRLPKLLNMDTLRQVSDKKIITKVIDTLRKLLNNNKNSVDTERSVSVSDNKLYDLKRKNVLKRISQPQTLRKISKDYILNADSNRSTAFNNKTAYDSNRHMAINSNDLYDTYRKITTDDLQYKDVAVYNADGLIALKYAYDKAVVDESKLWDIIPNGLKARRMTIKSYRRENGIWITGNTLNVKLSYRQYDANKKLLVDYMPVPSGELTSSYTTVEIELSKEAKYIQFKSELKPPTVSGKENRIKYIIDSVNVNNTKAAIMYPNLITVQSPTSEKPYWIYKHSITNAPKKACVIVNADNVQSTVDIDSFTDYENMPLSNKTKYDLTENSLQSVFIKSDKEVDMAWVEEYEVYIPTKVIYDTSRTLTSDYKYKWISTGMESLFVNEVSNKVSPGTSIIEKVALYELYTDSMSFITRKLEVVAYRSIDNAIFEKDFVQGDLDYLKISYSTDLGKTYKELVTDPANGYKTIIDIPQGIRRVLFKYSASNTYGYNLKVCINPIKHEVFYPKMNYFGNFNNTIISNRETFYYADTEGNKEEWNRYTLTMNMDENIPISDLFVEYNHGDSYVNIYLYDKVTGKRSLNKGKRVEFNPNIHSHKLEVCTKASNSAFPKQLYALTVDNKQYSTHFDTLRKTSGKLLHFIFDSNRKHCVNDLLSYDTKAIKTKDDVISLDLSKATTKDDSLIADTSKLTADYNSCTYDTYKINSIADIMAADEERKVVKEARVLLDTRKSQHKKDDIDSDTSRIKAIKQSLINDTKKKASVEDNKSYDSNRVLVSNDKANIDTCKNTMSNHLAVSDTLRINTINYLMANDSLRKTAKEDAVDLESKRTLVATNGLAVDTYRTTSSKDNVAIDSNRSISKVVSLVADINKKVAIRKALLIDTNKFVVRMIRMALDTRRRIRTTENFPVAMLGELKRIVRKDVAIECDTRRFMGFPYAITKFDGLRQIVYSKLHKYDVFTKTIKSSRSTNDSKREVLVSDVVKSDVQRKVYWKLYTKTNLDTFRKVIKEASIVNDTYKCVAVNSNVMSDTMRHVYFKSNILMDIDTSRITSNNIFFVADTSRLPFYFIDNVYDAKRSQVYQGKTFLFDTARDKYVIDMTRVCYDTLRTVNIINPYAKVYEYNIKVCNSLDFTIKI